jgi:ABC-type multidrug transport system fused ATPase/permease subunit
MSGGHGHGHDAGHGGPENKRIALLIALLALILAFSETLGKASQTSALDANIEASNLWAFFQAKTIRMTTVRAFAEAADIEARHMSAGEHKAALEKQIADWKKAAARYDSEPETQEGRKELSARAKAAGEKRDRALSAYHQYEVASAAVQIAIVLASAAIITSMAWLAWIAGALGLVGVAFSVIGFFAPTAVHLF